MPRATLMNFCIDKISITGGPVSVTDKSIGMRLRDLVQSNRNFMHFSWSLDYEVTAKIVVGPDATLFVQANSRRPGRSALRIESNPGKCGVNGRHLVRSIVDEIYEPGYDHFVSNGRITRLDLAVDLADTMLGDVLAHIGGFRKHAVHTGPGGVPETLYFGTANSNRLRIYNRIKDGFPKILRVERQMLNQGIGCKLYQMKNPFERVHLVNSKSLLPVLHGLTPRHFFGCVRQEGLSNTLTDVNPVQARQIKSAVADPDFSVMPTMTDIWDQWPSLSSRSLGIPFPKLGMSDTIKIPPCSHELHIGSGFQSANTH